MCLAVLLVLAPGGRPASAQGLFGGSDDGDRRNAEVGLRMNQIENQMRGLNGQIEQLTFQIRQLQDSMTRMQKDYEFRLQEIENGTARAGAGRPPPAPPPQKRSDVAPSGADAVMAAAPTGMPPNAMSAPETTRAAPRGAPPASLGQLSSNDPIGGIIGTAPLDLGATAQPGVATEGRSVGPITDPTMAAVPPGVDPRYASVPPTASPRDEYDAAYGYILNGEYALAETSFKTFLANHPTDRRIGSAQFWLGESYYARARHKEAADAFLKSYTQFPDGAKAPDSLLKLGLALTGLGEKKAACASWDELLVKYPKAAKAVRDRAAAEKTRVKC
ncbi:tol-pal system protein YbgF [Siculibacillus lacustris]|nr:tol-pal system protein YbgF [Siculibacillus lacustris]